MEEEDNEHHDHLEGEPERRFIQMSNECHDFDWYLQNVAANKFILDEDSSHHGKIKSGAYDAVCVDHLQRDLGYKQARLYFCATFAWFFG